LHANDYDGRRLFCGPYSGRSLELKEYVAGIVTNPNNDFPINFIPLRTLSLFLTTKKDWHPREAFESVLVEWHAHYETVADFISQDDLLMLADCFYLPHELGPHAEALCHVVQRLLKDPVEQWNGADVEFARLNDQIQHLFDKLTQLRDRELFYAWSRRAWDLKEELQLIEGFVAKKREGVIDPQLDTHLPDTYRGGIVARLQSGLAMDDDGHFHVVVDNKPRHASQSFNS
jgi:protein O-GlcNAcase/histone acetyltransferase